MNVDQILQHIHVLVLELSKLDKHLVNDQYARLDDALDMIKISLICYSKLLETL